MKTQWLQSIVKGIHNLESTTLYEVLDLGYWEELFREIIVLQQGKQSVEQQMDVVNFSDYNAIQTYGERA